MFFAVIYPVLGSIFWDYDEGWYIMDARHVARGLRPFVDFAYHQTPLYPYLLAGSAKVAGLTLVGYRTMSLASMAASGLLLFLLVRPYVGTVAALIAQGAFLFSQSQIYALAAVPEPVTVFLSLLGVLLVLRGGGAASAFVAAAAFVAAILAKPTCIVVVAAVVASLVVARAWRRVAQLGVSGLVFTAAAFAWMSWVSDGIFESILRFHLARLGTRQVGMWSIDSGFADMRRMLGIETPFQWAVFCFKNFCILSESYVPLVLLVVSLAGIPIWVARCARNDAAVRAFSVLWPASYLLLNFALVDYVSDKYFIPYLAISAFLLAGLACALEQRLGRPLVAVAGVVLCALLARQLVRNLYRETGGWYERTREIAREHQPIVSFTPMHFAATGTEPACGFDNPALTYGGFGEAFLIFERTRGFRWNDERLVECLKAHPDITVVIDWSFYFFTKPGGPLRTYLAGEGSGQRFFYSPEALAQWDEPTLTMPPG